MEQKEYQGIQMDPHMFDHIIGRGLGTRNMTYTWRDISLYGLGVGAHLSDSPYIYERCKDGFKALPTFAILPYINNLTMDLYTKVPLGTNELVRDFMEMKLGYMPKGLHMGIDLTVDGEIDPYKGTFIVEDKLNNVLDRGEGKGVVADCQMDVYDIVGRHVAAIHSFHYNEAFGGFGGDKFITPKVQFPEREPDYTATEFMVENIAAIYRLCGDTYKNHLDYDFACGEQGYRMPYTMGMCTLGFAVRMVFQQLFPYQPERVTRVYTQIRNVCFPGQNVTVQIWKDGPGRVIFKFSDADNRLLLSNSILEYKD